MVDVEPDLSDLFEDLPVKNFSGEWGDSINEICIDSRRVSPGAAFFALKGMRSDGNDYVEEAIERGATVVVSECPGRAHEGVAYVEVEDIRCVVAEVARRFHRYSSEKIDLVGITGTNGKTTVSFLLKHLLEKQGRAAGLIGTIFYDLGSKTIPAHRTTPESVDIYAMLAQMCEYGCRCGIMEVSSHSIDQKRIHGLEFRIAAFLNLTEEHMDYHNSMELYFKTKSELFNGKTGSAPRVAVVNDDNPYGKRLLNSIPPEVEVIRFGRSSNAEFYAEDIKLDGNGSRFVLNWPEGTREVSTSLLGEYNVSNILAALAISYALGCNIEQMIACLEDFKGVPGRLERIEEGQAFLVLVDYAHTEDAIKNVLTALQEVVKGRLLMVFGCGGSRDRKKRPLMTSTAMQLADLCWATTDNPRGDAIEEIFSDMRRGVVDQERISFVDDRRLAISQAIDAAEPEDCLLIAGKGHESFQEIKGSFVPFDDRVVTRNLLRLKKHF